MPTSPINTYSQLELQPTVGTALDRTIAIRLAPSQSIARGTILGELRGTDPVQTITPPGSGTFTITLPTTNVGTGGTTAAVAYNATLATVAAAISLIASVGNAGIVAGAGVNCVVSGTAGSSYVLTFEEALGDEVVGAVTVSAGSVAQTTAGVAVTPGQYKPYASGNSDGSQIPKVILMRDCQSDASGLITESPTNGQSGGAWGQKYPTTMAYFTGPFSINDLTGLDANAVTVIGGRIVQGNLTDGGMFYF